MKISRSALLLAFICTVSFFTARIVFAETNTTPSPSTTPIPQNPAPPIGLTPCGKTMCNKDEVCMKYPQDIDEHCVPVKLLPKLPPAPPEDLPEGLDLCPEGTGVYPPNSNCVNNIKRTQNKITEYDKTCIYQPVVLYEGERWATKDSPGNRGKEEAETQPFEMCGIGYAGPGNAPTAPGRPDKYDCAVNMLVYTDVRDAELGSYGPSAEMRDKTSEEYKSSDFIAQNYLYDSLFGSSLDLTDNNRESYRTYWRLLSANTQANLRSFILNMANSKQINDITFNFTDSNGGSNETSFQKLYDGLKKQVILFWHWPFVRVGCLTDYPVCPEYAQAISELRPNTESITNAILKAVPTNIDASLLNLASSALGLNLDGPYAAFTPLDFDSVRSYILKKQSTEEFEIYNWKEFNRDYLVNNLNRSRYEKKPPLTNVSRENIPYLGAIEQGLLSPKFGILSSIQPSWITTRYATDEGSTISNYRFGNKPEDFPEVKIAKKNFADFISEQVGNSPLQIITNTAIWVYEQAKDLFTDDKETGLIGYTDPDTDLTLPEIRTAYVNYKDCPLPLSYHLLSPKTAPEESPIPPNSEGEFEYTDHHQVVSIWGPQVTWIWDPKRDVQCGGVSGSRPKNTKNPNNLPDPDDGICYCEEWDDNEETFPGKLVGEDNPCINYTRHWTVSGIEDGKALLVLNNPKAMDIKKAVVQDKSFSLYSTLIPDSYNKKLSPTLVSMLHTQPTTTPTNAIHPRAKVNLMVVESVCP